MSLTPSAKVDLNHFTIFERRIIVEAMKVHLAQDANQESRRRKKLSANPLATWELRVGDLRVFFEIEDGQRVKVVAIGSKQHNDLYIRGRRVEL